MNVLSDEQVRAGLTPAVAVAAARTALVDSYRGLLASPPRLYAQLGEAALVFTAGGYPTRSIGFRVYGTWPGDSDQAVLVWDSAGCLSGCIVGTELGARRTGALGAAAVDALARPEASVVGVIGSGRQAWTQLWALTGVRRPSEVRVFSPNAAHRQAFAERARTEFGLNAIALTGPRDVVRGADIVVLATRSEHPVVDAEWVEAGTHINTVGPKTLSAHEAPTELVAAARMVVSDSPTQANAYGEPFFTDRDLIHLGAVLSGDVPGRQSDTDITVYCSTGLAGSEVLLAQALLERPQPAEPSDLCDSGA